MAKKRRNSWSWLAKQKKRVKAKGKVARDSFADAERRQQRFLRDNADFFLWDPGIALPDEATRVLVHHAVKIVPGSPFQHHARLQEAVFQEGCLEIGGFWNCSALERVVLPSTLCKISDYAFIYCRSLKQVALCHGIREIGRMAFCKCSALERLILPPTLTKIGVEAFGECVSLRDVKLCGGVQMFDGRPFDGCSSLEHIKLPPRVLFRKFGDAMSGECRLLTEGAAPPWGSESPREYRGQDNHKVMVASGECLRLMSATELTEICNVVGGLRSRGAFHRFQALLAYFKIVDATTVLELALWKVGVDKWKQSGDSQGALFGQSKVTPCGQSKVTADTSAARALCRVNCGAGIILRNVVPFLFDTSSRAGRTYMKEASSSKHGKEEKKAADQRQHKLKARATQRQKKSLKADHRNNKHSKLFTFQSWQDYCNERGFKTQETENENTRWKVCGGCATKRENRNFSKDGWEKGMCRDCDTAWQVCASCKQNKRQLDFSKNGWIKRRCKQCNDAFSYSVKRIREWQNMPEALCYRDHQLERIKPVPAQFYCNLCQCDTEYCDKVDIMMCKECDWRCCYTCYEPVRHKLHNWGEPLEAARVSHLEFSIPRDDELFRGAGPPASECDGGGWVMGIRNLFRSIEAELLRMEDATDVSPYCVPGKPCSSAGCCGMPGHKEYATLLARLYGEQRTLAIGGPGYDWPWWAAQHRVYLRGYESY